MTTSRSLLQGFADRPARVCVAVLAATAVLIYALPWQWALSTWLIHGFAVIDITERDFVNYWMAGKLTVAGSYQELFSHDVYFPRLQELFGADIEIRSWSYPPHFLLFLWPLGFLDYVSALVAFLVVTFALFIVAVGVFRAHWAPRSDIAILWPALLGYTVMMVDATQNGFLIAAFVLFGLAWMKTRPVLAGLAFACLTVKPQLGVLLPLLLLFDRNWRTIFWSVAFTLVMVGASIVLFGVESWHAYLTETLAYQRSVMTQWYGGFLLMMPTVFGSVRALGYSPDVAMIAQWPVSICSAALLMWFLGRERDPLCRIFAVVCGTFLVSPYGFNYDMGALSAVAAMLASSKQMPNRAAATVIAATAALAGVLINLGRAGIPLAPAILAASLLVVAARARRRIEDSVPHSASPESAALTPSGDNGQ
jgi:hypothetical protein